MTQTLSLKMSQHLSSLAPGFEGHYGYYYKPYSKKDNAIGMENEPEVFCIQEVDNQYEFICPAWKVEDVLRETKNIKALESVCIECERKGVANSEDNCDHCGMNYSGNFISNVYNLIYKISEEMASNPDTAYQKIEEYLWSILT